MLVGQKLQIGMEWLDGCWNFVFLCALLVCIFHTTKFDSNFFCLGDWHLNPFIFGEEFILFFLYGGSIFYCFFSKFGFDLGARSGAVY